MPRLKKKIDATVSGPAPSDLTQSLTAGRSRRTIKPNPKYLNDEMVVPSAKGTETFEGSGMSEDEYELDDEELEQLIVRKTMPSSTPQSATGPRRRGRPRKNPEQPRTEPIKNLRKEVLKKMDYKTISISQSRHIGISMMRDGRRKLEMSVDSVESDSADHDEMEEMEEKLSQSSDGGEEMNASQKVLNPAAFKKHLAQKTILERRGSGATKSSMGSKITAATTEEDDDEDFYNDSDAKMSQAEQVVPAKRPVGRPRKYPLKQQISPYVRKVLLPSVKNSNTGNTIRRKMAGTDTDEEEKHETQQSKMLRRSYGLKHVNSKNRSMETESDENEGEESDEGKRRAMQRARSFPSLSGRPLKNAYLMSKQKMLSKASDASLKSPTITYVNVKDIMKKSKSSSDIRRRMDQEQEQEQDSEEVSEMEDMRSNSKDGETQSGDRPKTHNQLVASILERKRPIAIENEQNLRRGAKRKDRESLPGERMSNKLHRRTLDMGEVLTENDIVDFEDMLQKNIVSASKGQRQSSEFAAVSRGRGRPSENARPNQNASGGFNKSSINLYRQSRLAQHRSGRGRGGGLKRLSQPPRILNATMKLGDGRPLSKMSSTSADNHYSIDLADPDNNVKLVSSTDTSPTKRTLPTIGGYAASGGAGSALRNFGNARPGMVLRENQRVSAEFKKKKVTCYERWHVISSMLREPPVRKVSIFMSMIGLGNIAGDIKVPSDTWSLRTILEKRKTPPSEGDEVFTGDVQDTAIADEDKPNYEPIRVMFRRKALVPGRFNVQYDRTVIFRSDCYTVNIDGQSCRLVGAPFDIKSVEDIEVLLSIVDYIDLKNSCIEVVSSQRTTPEHAPTAFKRIAGGKGVAV